jgi:multiple sugar transport system permease protein
MTMSGDTSARQRIERLAAPPRALLRWRIRVRYAIWRPVVLILFLAWSLIPILYMVSVSFKPSVEVMESGAFLPHRFDWHNWPDAFSAIPLAHYLLNSLLIAVGSTALTLLLAVPTTYSFVRFRTGGSLLPAWVLGTYVAPPIVFAVPVLLIIRAFGLVDTTAGVALVHAVANLAVAVWLLDGFVRAVPEELDAAAAIDGCSRLRTLWSVVIPVIMPGLVATAIICMILSWNEFLFALVLTYSPNSQTYPVGLSLFLGTQGLQYGQIAAAALTGMLPVYVLAFIFQRWLVRGLTLGAIK